VQSRIRAFFFPPPPERATMPHDTFTTPPMEFAPLAGEAAEQTLQAALVPLLRQHSNVTRAYLARVRYDGKTGGLVLGLLTSGDDDEELVGEIGKLFASLFDASQHLDIIFVSNEQLAALHKVAAAFYVRKSKALRFVASLFRSLCLLLLIQPVSAVLSNPAHACACCSERGSRVDKSVLLDEPTRVQIERMKFAGEAALGGDIGDNERSPLRAGLSSSYEVTVTREKSVLAFAFRDPVGRNGRLSFVMPPRVWIFAVDPFGDAKDEGLGPLLYKEWRLTAPVKGDGIFRRGTPFGQTATLIFHGSGRGCTEAEHFSDWSLLLQGPAGKATFYGKLEAP